MGAFSPPSPIVGCFPFIGQFDNTAFYALKSMSTESWSNSPVYAMCNGFLSSLWDSLPWFMAILMYTAFSNNLELIVLELDLGPRLLWSRAIVQKVISVPEVNNLGTKASDLPWMITSHTFMPRATENFFRHGLPMLGLSGTVAPKWRAVNPY